MLLHFGLAAANGGRDSIKPKDGKAILYKIIPKTIQNLFA